MTHGHGGKQLLSHLGDELECSLAARNSACFNAFVTLNDGSVFGREGAQQRPRVVTVRLGFFPVKEAVEP